MNKHTAIVIVACIVIAIPFVFAGWNIYAIEQIQFVGADEKNFNYFDMINNGKINACNPHSFFVVIDHMTMNLIFDQVQKGVFSIQDVNLEPNTITTIQGKFTSSEFEEMQYLALHFDGMFKGDTPIRIDPQRMIVKTEIHTPIIGVIPYSVSQEYSGFDFWNMLNDKDKEFSC